MIAGQPGARSRILVYLVWLAVAGWLASRHVMWRDEVRALTFALQGDDPVSMLGAMRGDGHPALWHLMLRGLLDLFGTVRVLPVLAFAVGAGTALLVALRAPFRLPVLAIVLFGGPLLYEYTVMARNYGIGVLILFIVVLLYPGCRDRGLCIGILLALLCNTNLHAVIMAAGMLAFWAVEIVCEDGLGWTRAWRRWLANAAVTGLGALACAAMIYPPRADLPSLSAAALPPAQRIVALALHAGDSFWLLLPAGLNGGAILLLPVVMIGSLLAFARAPAALVGAAVMLVGQLALFGLVYPGGYRHQALSLMFVVAMAWLVAEGRGGHRRAPRGLVATGEAMLLVLLALQLPYSVARLNDARAGVPESRSRDLALILHRPMLARAIVIADPDFMLEPLGYYAGNPVYLVRERRYGRLVSMSRGAARPIGFADILATARMLHARTGRPIVIALRARLDGPVAPAVRPRGGYGPLVIVPADVAAFRAATHRIARFGAAASGESYDVYTLAV